MSLNDAGGRLAVKGPAWEALIGWIGASRVRRNSRVSSHSRLRGGGFWLDGLRMLALVELLLHRPGVGGGVGRERLRGRAGIFDDDDGRRLR
jgi:hypothetical protein